MIAALPEARGPRRDPYDDRQAPDRASAVVQPALPAPTPGSVPGVAVTRKSLAMVSRDSRRVPGLGAQLIAASHQPPLQVGDGNTPLSTSLSPNTQTVPVQR